MLAAEELSSPVWSRRLLWTLLGLNCMDAALTVLVVGSGLAIEGNPIVRLIGIPGKLVLVAVAGWLVARLRPQALVVPIIALTAVVAYSSVGLLLHV